jgi:hypothetical protein
MGWCWIGEALPHDASLTVLVAAAEPSGKSAFHPVPLPDFTRLRGCMPLISQLVRWRRALLRFRSAAVSRSPCVTTVRNLRSIERLHVRGSLPASLHHSLSAVGAILLGCADKPGLDVVVSQQRTWREWFVAARTRYRGKRRGCATRHDVDAIGILRRRLAGPRDQQIAAASDGAEQRRRAGHQNMASPDRCLHVSDTPCSCFERREATLV